MVWNDTNAEIEKKKLIRMWMGHQHSIVDLARMFGIAERTAHRVINRFKDEGWEGLKERSRARHTQPDATPANVVAAIVDARRAHPKWGPRKLRAFLAREAPEHAWPAPSTIGSILDRQGLVESRFRRRQRNPAQRPCVDAVAPNISWSIDYKGQFRTSDGKVCYPLTIIDNCSRYLLHCKGLPSPTTEGTWNELVRCFREHGLPVALRSDNGSPFGGSGLTGLSKLAVRLIRLGILPDFIRPASPQQNGRQERFHGTLKRETAQPPAGDRAAQQRRFNSFLEEYNEVRPHEALGNKVPADVHVQSSREFPSQLPKVEYDEGVITRAVRPSGCFKWDQEEIFISETLVDERIAFVPIESATYLVRFANYPIAVFDEVRKKLFHAGWKPTNKNSRQPMG